MVASQNSIEPKFVNEALSGPNAKELIDTMEDVIKSMRTDQV